MNRLIQIVAEAGLSNVVYQGFHIVNISALLIFYSIFRKKYHLKFRQILLSFILFYPLGYLWIMILTWIENGFQGFGANNIVRGFVYFPLLAILPAKWQKIDRNVMFDIMAPGQALLQGVAHIACMFAGCCYGYPSARGLWNPVFYRTLFPIQPIESIVSLLVFAACLLYAKKTKYCGNGRVYPLFLILFGFTRFFLEFFRNNDKLFWGISNLAIHAAFMFVVGVIWFVISKKKQSAGRKQKV